MFSLKFPPPPLRRFKFIQSSDDKGDIESAARNYDMRYDFRLIRTENCSNSEV